MVKPRVPKLKEYIDEILRAEDKLPILTDALKYYDAVELWCIHAEVTGDLEPGRKHTRYNIAKSHDFWNRFIAPKASPKEFIERLAEPHLEVDETLAIYRRRYPNEDIDEAVKTISKTHEKLEKRNLWELRVLSPSVETWIKYIEWESEPEFQQGLFRRATCDFPNEPKIWNRWIQEEWDDDAIEISERAAALCPQPSIDTTRVFLGHGTAESPDSKLAQLCGLMNESYDDIDVREQFKQLATKYIKESRDAEFIGYVQSMLLVIDKSLSQSLWVLKSDEMYKEWFNCKRMMLVPDITEYFQDIIELQDSNRAVLKEKLRAYLVLGFSKEADETMMSIRELELAEKASACEQVSVEPPRNRENTSLVVFGPISKENLYKALDASEIVSSKQFSGYHLVEMSTPHAKKVALATLMFSKTIKGVDFCQDAADTTLWVTNYPVDWTETEIDDAFSVYGAVLAVRFPRTNGRRFCYVQMSNSTEAAEAILGIRKSYPDLVVKLSDPSSRAKRTDAVEEQRQIYLSGLDFHAPKSQLIQWITSHSIFPANNIQIPPSKRGRTHDGYAFVEYSSAEQAKESSVHFNSLDHAGRQIRATISRKKRRYENPHVLTVENVHDLPGLKALIDGEFKYNEDTHVAQVILESQQQVGKAMLKVQGRELNGHVLRVRTDLKPRRA